MIKKWIAIAALALLPALSMAATGLESSGIDVQDKASMQRGAATFMNYCSGCHALGFQRYSRMAEDLGMSEEQVMEHLVFTDAKFGELITTAMPADQAEKWFGTAPPDLSLIARNKAGGPDWVYTFLKSFYRDESRPTGWNNTLMPGVSMPHVLWEQQGTQEALRDDENHVTGLELAQPGTQSAEEYDRTVRDLTNFLNYVGEPAALKRRSFRVGVLIFLGIFAVFAWFLKREYWSDVH